MCRVLAVSSSGYYQWLKKPQDDGSHMDPKDFLIRSEFENYRGKHGSPRISKGLCGKGHPMSQSTVARRMKKMELRVKKKRKYQKTTDSAHPYAVAHNLLDQNFTALTPNAVWVSDITYLPTETGWVYLVVILDLFSRKIVGWQTSISLNHSFVVNALNLAVMRRKPPEGLIFHSDRGVQYACYEFTKVLIEHRFLQSMSGKGNCYDNAVAESFFKTLKYELIDGQIFYDKNDLDRVMFRKIEMEYNCRRMHSTLDYKTPDAFEKDYFNQIRLSECLFS
jgi:putative transposase